jgi:hypothetical protein
VVAVTATVVAGLLAGAALAGPTYSGAKLALVLGGLGLLVAVLCLLGSRKGFPWSVLVLVAAATSAVVAGLLAYVVVRGDSETFASLASSTLLGAFFGAGCAGLVRLVADDASQHDEGVTPGG